MAEQYADVVRVETSTASLPTTLRNQMLGMESDIMRRMMYKDSNGNDLYFTPDGMTGINAADVEYVNSTYPGLSNVHDALSYAFGASEAGLTGTGTAGYIPKLDTATSIVNSIMQDNGSAITIGGQIIVTGLTASQIVETDASKQLTSAAKNTGYNKVLGTAAGTVSEGDHLHAGVYEPVLAAGTSLQYYRGDKSWATLNTAAVPEVTNLYYTDTRARLAVSASSPLSYNNSTGAFTHLDTAGNKHVPTGTVGRVPYWSESGLFAEGSMRDNGSRIGIGGDVHANVPLLIHSAQNEVLQLRTTSETGSPFLTFNQGTTRVSYIQHEDASNDFNLASMYGDLSFWTDTVGVPIERMRIYANGTGKYNGRLGVTGEPDSAAKLNITATSATITSPHLLLTDTGGVHYSSLCCTNVGGLMVNMTNPAFGLVSTSATGSPELGFYQESLISANYKGNVRWEDDGDTLEVTNYFGDILLRPGSAGTAVSMFSLSPTVMTLSCEDPKILLNDTGTDQYDCALHLTGGVLRFLGNSTSGAPATAYFQLSMSNGYATFDGTVRVVGATSAGIKIVQTNADGELTFVNAAGSGNRTVMVDSDGAIYFA